MKSKRYELNQNDKIEDTDRSQVASDDEVLCRCHGVKTGEVKDVVKRHQPTRVSEVVKHTKAGSTCGHCEPFIEDVIKEHSSLEKNGGVRWNVCLRQIHLWLSLVSFLIVFLFAFTGYVMNHESLFGSDEVEFVEKEFSVPESIVLDKASSQFMSWLKEEQNIRGRVSYVERDEESLTLRTEAPGYECEILVDVASRTGELFISEAGLLAALSDLHKGRGLGDEGGAWFIDFCAIAVMIVSLSGVVLFFVVGSRWKTGLTFVLTNGILFLIVWLFISR